MQRRRPEISRAGPRVHATPGLCATPGCEFPTPATRCWHPHETSKAELQRRLERSSVPEEPDRGTPTSGTKPEASPFRKWRSKSRRAGTPECLSKSTSLPSGPQPEKGLPPCNTTFQGKRGRPLRRQLLPYVAGPQLAPPPRE